MRTAIFLSIFLSISNVYANAGFNASFDAVTCLSCSVPDGLLVSDLSDSTATLSWNAVTGATKYNVEIEDEQNGPSTFKVETTVTGTTYAASGLQAGVLYKFKVRAQCGGDKSAWSDWVFFKATNNGGGGGSSTCDIPSGLVVSVVNGVATLGWNAVAGAVKYTIEVEDEQNGPSTFHLEDISLSNTYSLAGLQTGVLYKFKVKTHCANGQSDWSSWMFFNGAGGGQGGGSGSGACAIPGGLTAAVSGGSATLSWGKVSGALQYYIEVEDEQNNPGNFHLEVSVQDTFYIVTGLQAGVSYKFKVRSHCATDQSDWSNWLFFNGNTGNGGIGSGSGDCNRPSGSQVSNVTLNSVLLSWNAVAGVDTYTLEIEREQNGNSAWQITQVANTNSFLLAGLNADTKYKFKVRSNCPNGGHSNWTKWKKFKTDHNLTGNPGGANLNITTEDRNDSDTRFNDTNMEITAWPNPVQTYANIRLQHLNTAAVQVQVFNLVGRLVLEKQVQAEKGTWEGRLDLDNLSNGVYLIQAKSGMKTQTIKLVVSQ